jgi:hypothetical protein
MKNLLLSVFLSLPCLSYAQNSDDLLSRVNAISYSNAVFYEVGGVEISREIQSAALNPKQICKKFKNLNIKKSDFVGTDSLLGEPNFSFRKIIEEPIGIQNHYLFYFLEQPDQKVIGFQFSAIDRIDRDLARKFIGHVLKSEIPVVAYHKFKPDSVNFIGRYIHLGARCQWMAVNSLQCQFNGQMNWSMHKNQADASAALESQIKYAKTNKVSKVISTTTVKVVFEGTETTATKLVYDYKGITSALLKTSGAETLTVYYVTTPVRGHFVSCVMSHWNNDGLNTNGLPALIEQVMKLK